MSIDFTDSVCNYQPSEGKTLTLSSVVDAIAEIEAVCPRDKFKDTHLWMNLQMEARFVSLFPAARQERSPIVRLSGFAWMKVEIDNDIPPGEIHSGFYDKDGVRVVRVIYGRS